MKSHGSLIYDLPVQLVGWWFFFFLTASAQHVLSECLRCFRSPIIS